MTDNPTVVPSQLRPIEFLGSEANRLAGDAVGDPSHPPVLLLHGGGQTRHSWHTTLQSVGGDGWHAISMDLRGHGDSEWPASGDYSLEAFGADVLAVARTFATPPVLIGASLGGTSALAAIGSTRDPVASALVMVDVAPNIEPAGANRIRTFMTEHFETGFASLADVAKAVHEYNPHRPPPKDLSGLRKNVRQAYDGRWYWHWDPRFITNRPIDDDETRALVMRSDLLEAAARSLTIPTLLVRGRQSDLLSEDGARKFLAMAPHAQFADVGGAGHMVAGDRNDSFNDSVLTFLATVR